MAHYQLMRCDAVRTFVRRREYLTWPEDPQDLDWFYERLVSLLLKDTKVKTLVPEGRQEASAQDPERVQLRDIRTPQL